MKEEIHPTYYPNALVVCACGNTWTTGSTTKEIHTDVCSNCHPFFTGEQRIVDTEGQVDRFYKKLQARKDYIEEIEAREAAKVSPERPIAELQRKLTELKDHPDDHAIDISFEEEVALIEKKIEETRRQVFLNLTPWQRVQLARHPKRPCQNPLCHRADGSRHYWLLICTLRRQV